MVSRCCAGGFARTARAVLLPRRQSLEARVALEPCHPHQLVLDVGALVAVPAYGPEPDRALSLGDRLRLPAQVGQGQALKNPALLRTALVRRCPLAIQVDAQSIQPRPRRRKSCVPRARLGWRRCESAGERAHGHVLLLLRTRPATGRRETPSAPQGAEGVSGRRQSGRSVRGSYCERRCNLLT